MSHLRMRSLPGSSRAQTSLRTRRDRILGRTSESTAIDCFGNWMVMTVSSRKGVNLWSFACQHRGLLTEDFEPTRAILGGNDEGLLAHVGPDVHLWVRSVSRSVLAATVSPAYARRVSARPTRDAICRTPG